MKAAQLSTLADQVWPGDFNGDGITDLAATEAQTGGSVVVQLGNGDGTFRAAIRTGVAGTVLGLADFNGDGRADLIVRAAYPGPVEILPSNGNGTFAAPREVAQYDSATFALSADFNGDGKRDLAIAAEANTLDVFPGNGDFTFGTPATLVTGYFPHGGVVADLNNDGRRDIAVANRYSNSLSIFINQGSLTFATTEIALGLSAADVTAADLDGDGRQDLAVAVRSPADPFYQFEEGYVDVLAGRGDGTFKAPVSYTVPNGATQIVAGDFTRDGRIDLATANNSFTYRDDCGPGYGGTDSVTILPGIGGGAFGAASSSALTGYQNSVTSLNTSDLDRDGSTDLIASNGFLFFTKTPGANGAPVANAGRDEYVSYGEIVLHASAIDPDGDFLTYEWRTDTGEIIRHTDPCVYLEGYGYHTFTLTVDDGHGHRVSDTVTYSYFPEPPPASPDAYRGGDIGAVAAAGSSSYDGTVYTVTGSGADIWNTADEFQFDQQALSGNFVLTVRVDAVQNVDVWTKAGLMIREDLTAGARHASLFVSPGKGVAFQRRPLANAASVHTAGPLTTAPVWLKLLREGDVISAYVRKAITDPWTPIGSQTLSGLSPTVYAGLAVSSHRDGVLATAKFSQLTAEPTRTWTAMAIGAATGSASTDGATFTVKGSGADIWNAQDAFEYLWTDWTGDAVLTARVRSVQNTNAWAKAGVMMRKLLAAGSAQVDLIVSPGKGVAMQYRAADGGGSANVAIVAGAAPEWLRLVRRSGVIEGFMSKDGSVWSSVGSVAVDLGSSMYAGLAVTSHATASEATAVFDDVSVIP